MGTPVDHRAISLDEDATLGGADLENVRDDVRVGRGGIERERELPVGPWSPDSRGHDDEVARRVEARDLSSAPRSNGSSPTSTATTTAGGSRSMTKVDLG